MGHLWIAESAAAALCQSLRYAVLKDLNRHLSTLVSTYVRILFSFPLQMLYVAIVLFSTGASLPPLNLRFLICSGVTATAQFMSTALMIRLFQLGNFAVGTMLAKSDVILTALIGTMFFSENITGLGWVAILLTLAGVLVISVGRMPASAWRQGEIGLFELLLGKSVRLGFVIGLINALAYLLLKEAMLSLDPQALPVVRAAYAGFAMTVFSVVLLGGWLLATEREGLMRIRHHQFAGWSLGVLSALGTILWYLATVGANASYVAAVAQVQVVFSLMLSRYYFNEVIRPIEIAGIVTMLAGVLMFRLV